MFRLTKTALAACALAVIAVPASFAADLYVPDPVPVPPPAFGGWYLRGDIGFSNQRVGNLDNALYANFDSVNRVHYDFDAAPIFGLGVGYRVNKWFRADITGEYRAKADFDGLDIGFIEGDPDGPFFPNDYNGGKSEWLALANLYVDLGSYWGITPFVGAGIGASRNTIHNFTDTATVQGSVAYADDDSDWNFAWALYAGLGYEVTPALTMELAYRYVDLGDAKSGDLVRFDGVNEVNNPMEFEDLTSHDVRLGFRYALQ
jgi:opacity protein-like surface antigen